LRRAIILAITGFVLVLIALLPARWIGPLLPHAMHCQQLDGSAWRGSCSGLTTANGALGDLSWDLHVLQLLRGRLELRLDLTNQDNYVRGVLGMGLGGALHGRDVTLDLPLTSALLSSFPAGAHARLSGKLSRFDWNGKFLEVLQGEVEILDFVNPQGQAFGSYQAVFAPDANAGGSTTPTGVVHDLGGPLALDATLQFTRDPGYLLQGQVAARPSAPAEFADELKYLGSPDASGRRPFSLSGTF
jgi:general secretion pathway protein N